MISNLLYKELRLAAHPNLFIFALMGPLVLVPSYPYTMVFTFCCIGIYVNFMYARETNDLYYSALLPIKKSDVVKGKVAVTVTAQLASLIISVPFAIINQVIFHTENKAGIAANIAFYGVGLIIFGLFNLVFLSEFFKTVYRAGNAFIKALIPVLIVQILVEVLAHFPGATWAQNVTNSNWLGQTILLVVGLIIYLILTYTSFKISVRRFAQVNL